MIATPENILLIAGIITGEWPFDAIGQWAEADVMAARMDLWGHDIADIQREFKGRSDKPSKTALWLAERLLNGDIKHSGYLFIFSTQDVTEILPGMGFKPGPADLEINLGSTHFGLRLYRTAEKWKGK